MYIYNIEPPYILIDSSDHKNFLNKDSNSPGDLLSMVKEHVLSLFNRHADARLLFHNYRQTVEIVNNIDQIAEAENFNGDEKEIAALSAWFLNTGYLFNYGKAEAQSLDRAQEFLQTKKYSERKIERCLDCIKIGANRTVPTAGESRLLIDAINVQGFTHEFFQKSPLLKAEWELVKNSRMNSSEWNQFQLQRLLNTKFYTAYAKEKYEPAVAQNILIQKGRTDKARRNERYENDDYGLKKFQNLERKTPNSATQTFFRANYRNHINLSAIADNKANIMISVNAILISVLISILSYRNIPETNPMVLLPVVIFLVTGLTSLIFAVLSIRPKVTSLNENSTNIEEVKKNIVFFGNYVNLDLDKYKEALDAVLRSGELIYGNMARDLYYLGKVLDKKYRYLTMSYNIFMIGFVATVVTFLFALFS